MSSTYDEEVKEMMRQLMRVIDGNDGLRPDVAMPALLYVTGFVLGQAKEGVPLTTIYLQICSDIEHSRAITASSIEMQDAMERMKEGA